MGWNVPNPVNALNETAQRFPFAGIKKKSRLSAVEVNVPEDDTSVNGTDKTVKDIQTGIQIKGDKITGTSNYLEDITGAGGEGNYLVLELPQAKDEGNTVKCKFEGGKEITLSTTDYQYLIKLTESGKKPITVTVTGKVNDTRTLDISGVTLSPKTIAYSSKKTKIKTFSE